MTIDETIQYWINTAEENMISAEAVFLSGQYDWCLFIAHLALEKILKANWVKYHQDINAPMIHNLVRLAELSGLNLGENENNFLKIVNGFQLETRYPAYKNEFHKKATKEFSEGHLKLIKEKYQWFKSLIK